MEYSLKAKLYSLAGLTSALLLLAGPAAFAADVSFYTVYKRQVYTQSSAGTPTPQDYPYVFTVLVELTASNSVSAATLVAPNSTQTSIPLVFAADTSPQYWQRLINFSYSDLGSLNSAWPDGTYTLVISGAHDGLQTPPLNLSGEVYPSNAPHIQNFTAAQAVVASQNFTLQWDAFGGGTTNDYIELTIARASDGTGVFTAPFPNQTNAMRGTVTSIMIPANTLVAGQIYYANLEFFKVVATNTANYPGVLGATEYTTETTFPLAAIAGVSAPVVTTSPQSQATVAGSSVQLSVSATGSAPLAYQWRFDSNNIYGATNAVYTLNNVQVGNSGYYDAVVTNPSGETVSGEALIQVTNPPPPVITLQPLGHTVAEGGSVTLQVAVSSLVTPTFQWFLNGSSLPGAASSTLVIANAQAAQSGTYQVLVQNPGGVALSAEAQLVLLSPGQNGTKAWSFASGGVISASAATIGPDGAIYFGCQDSNLYCLNASGTKRWQYKAGNILLSGSAALGFDGTVYIGSSDYKLNAVSSIGSPLWSFATQGIIASSPAIAGDGTVYVTSLDGNLYAISKTGAKKWLFHTGGGIGSSPVVRADGSVIFGSEDGNIYCVTANGAKAWQFGTEGAVIASAAIGADGTIYDGSDDHYVYALNTNGTLKWRFPTGYDVRSPVIGTNGTIYVGSADSHVYALTTNGTQIWAFTTEAYVGSGLSLAEDGTIYVGDADGIVYAINANGTEKWEFQTGSSIDTTPVIASDGKIVFGAYDSNFYAINETATLAASPWPKHRRDNWNAANLSIGLQNFARQTNGNVSFALTGALGESQRIQVSSNLSSWTTLTNLPATTNGFVNVLDQGAATNAARFYRALLP